MKGMHKTALALSLPSLEVRLRPASYPHSLCVEGNDLSRRLLRVEHNLDGLRIAHEATHYLTAIGKG